MGKRFTATEKWMDPWFRSLPPEQKLGWNYLCDNCDAAGVIDLDRGAADFFIGQVVDWDSLLKAAGERIAVIKKGKLWLTGFIQFQYGRLSAECRAHNPVFALIEKHSLADRVLDTYPMATNSHKEQDKDKDKDKDSEGGSGGKPKLPAKRFTPPTVSEVAAYCRDRKNLVDAQQFVDFYTSKGWKVGKNPMVDWKSCVRTWERNGVDVRAGPDDPRGTKSAVAEFILRGKSDVES